MIEIFTMTKCQEIKSLGLFILHINNDPILKHNIWFTVYQTVLEFDKP